jgi:hypothetical protein
LDLDLDVNLDGLVRGRPFRNIIYQIVLYPFMSKSTPGSEPRSTTDEYGV